MKIRTNFNTGISFWKKINLYEPGKGNTVSWELYFEGTMSVFPCEWRTNFRVRDDENFQGDAEGNVDFAKVRMPYIPKLYDDLQTASIVIVKGGQKATQDTRQGIFNQSKFNLSEIVMPVTEPDLASANVYSLWGGVDNMHEENRWMEFSVRRYEVT